MEKKLKELEASLSSSTEENLSLKKEVEKLEESWKTRLESAEKKLAEAEKALKSFTDLLGDLVKAIWGMNLLSFSLTRIYILFLSYS